MRLLRGFVAATMLALIALLITQEDISPGLLHPVHAQIAELRGESACAVCHGGPAGQMTESCLSCHKDIESQRLGETGIHGSIDLSTSCGKCHIEHRGQSHALTGNFSFSGADIGKQAQYKHDHGTGIELLGKHLDLDCDSCHINASRKVLEPGQKRYLGLNRNCASCHEDTHKGLFGRDCASCHGQQESFGSLDSFDHTRYPLVGEHEKAECRDCHETSGETSILELQKIDGSNPRQCDSCHASPHTEPFVRSAAEPSTPEACTSCHDAQDESFWLPNASLTAQQHLATGFSLAPPHNQLECSACHKDRRPLSVESPSRQTGQCKACHTDPHVGQFDSGQTQGQCLECHSPTTFKPSTFDLREHDSTGFALTGSHRAIRCVACHSNPSKKASTTARQFANTPTRCDACHSNPHGDTFAESAKVRIASQEPDCSRCHNTRMFRDDDWDDFDHKQQVGFELKGKHATASCDQCHSRERPNEETRPLSDASPACSSCHTDPHLGQFRTTKGNDCGRCHSEDLEWKDHSYDHAKNSRFQLDKQHSSYTCSACHKKTRIGKGRTVVRYKPLGTTCADCHMPTSGRRATRRVRRRGR